MTTTRSCPMGGRRCPESICDCFIEHFPDAPLGMHPEMFIVGKPDSEVS